ncbi:MAG TPA: hypothetical protein VK427_12565 [Kofleriaceae bacterium]|nr:hypothetical protein [Kofleriaceae bacterium]
MREGGFHDDDENEVDLAKALPLWDKLRRLAERLEGEVRDASLRANDRWRAIEPQLWMLEQRVSRSGRHITTELMLELTELGGELERLRLDIARGEHP